MSELQPDKSGLNEVRRILVDWIAAATAIHARLAVDGIFGLPSLASTDVPGGRLEHADGPAGATIGHAGCRRVSCAPDRPPARR